MSAFTDWTVTELEGFRKELGQAIATGASRVRFMDRDVTYRSLIDMRQTASDLDAELNARSGIKTARRLHVISEKGFA